MASAFDRVPDRRNPNTLNRWTLYPKGVISMSIADMDFRSPPAVLAALTRALDQGVLGYELASKPLLETVAGRMDRLYGWKVDPDWIVPTTGIVSAFHVAARAFCTDRKGYLIQPPVYNEFFSLKPSLGLEQYEAPLLQSVRAGILEYDVDWDEFKRQVKRAGIFLLCNPHNPIGKVYSRGELKRMADLCLEHEVTIVSDEIHSELLMGGAKFAPMAKLSRAIEQQTVTLVSPSKTFNVPGLFCGFAIIPNANLRQRYVKVVLDLRMHVNTLGLHAARAAFSGRCDGWLGKLLDYLTANRDYVVDYVLQNLPGVTVTRPAGTYLAWLDCSNLMRQQCITGSPYEFFLKEAKVAFGEGRIYGETSANFVRLNYGCTRRTLKQGLDRVRDSLYRRKRG